jgi:hypothetical protein
MATIYFLFYLMTTVDCFYFQKDNVEINYKVTSFKTCVDIPEMSKLSITSVPLNDCVFNCAVTWNCDGLVFKRQFPLCELYKGGVSESPGNCVHIKREDIHDVSFLIITFVKREYFFSFTNNGIFLNLLL